MMKFETSSSSSSDREASNSNSTQPKSTGLKRLLRRLSSKKGDSSNNPPHPQGGECRELKQVFQYIDENGDGKISPSELQSCGRILGGEITSEEAEAAVRSSDSDGDGLLGFEDFAKLMEVNGEEAKSQDLREAFRMYESMEGSGCITAKSLKKMLKRLGESKTTTEECKGMIRVFDLNGDGVISFDEFAVMMQ